MEDHKGGIFWSERNRAAQRENAVSIAGQIPAPGQQEG